MQEEVLSANPASRIRMLGVNLAGAESANPLTVEGRTLPLLQDTSSAAAWASWSAEQSDVVILDAENRAVGLFRLTVNSLSYAPDYDLLLDYLRLTAGE